MNGELTLNKNGHIIFPITDDLFIGADWKLYRGSIDDPDDCPRCKFRNGCPTGRVYYGVGTHRCNQGIFELGNPETAKPIWRPKIEEAPVD